MTFRFLFFSRTGFASSLNCEDPIKEHLQGLRGSYNRDLENEDIIFHVVLGNESADIDSMAGPIARAKYLSLCSPHRNEVFYPVINIPRDQFHLRRDAQFLFSFLGVSPEALVFVDEIDLVGLQEKGRLKVHLVDHNELTRSQAFLGNSVATIVDHHVDEGIEYPECLGINKLIQRVGSVSSLIALDLIDKSEGKLHSSWASLLLAAVLLDTRNLKNEIKRTKLDIKAGKNLKKLIKSAKELECLTLHLTQDEFFEKLSKARSNVEGLTAKQRLLKDKKRYYHGAVPYVISSFPKGCDYPWDKDEKYVGVLEEFLLNEEAEVVGILESSKGKTRNFHIHCDSPERLEKILGVFKLLNIKKKIYRREFAIATLSLPDSTGRKILQPLLARILIKLNKEKKNRHSRARL